MDLGLGWTVGRETLGEGSALWVLNIEGVITQKWHNVDNLHMYDGEVH